MLIFLYFSFTTNVTLRQIVIWEYFILPAENTRLHMYIHVGPRQSAIRLTQNRWRQQNQNFLLAAHNALFAQLGRRVTLDPGVAVPRVLGVPADTDRSWGDQRTVTISDIRTKDWSKYPDTLDKRNTNIERTTMVLSLLLLLLLLLFIFGIVIDIQWMYTYFHGHNSWPFPLSYLWL